MLGAVFESVVVTLYKGLAVYRLEAVEFTNEGELLFEMFHRGHFLSARLGTVYGEMRLSKEG